MWFPIDSYPSLLLFTISYSFYQKTVQRQLNSKKKLHLLENNLSEERYIPVQF